MLKFHALNVREVRQESEDAIRLVLDVPADLAADYRAAAGQHVVLRSRSGTDEARRTYSLTGPAGALPLTLGVRIHPHGQFSRHLAQNVHAGDALDVMPPNGSFGAALATAEATAAGKSAGATGTYVAFASGCGITPVLSIVRTLLETQPAARVQLYYLSRPEAIIATPTDQSITGVERKTVAMASAIASSCARDDFRPHPGRLCDFCTFRPYCPAHGGDPLDAAELRGPGTVIAPTLPLVGTPA